MNTAMTVRCDWCGEEIRWNEKRTWLHDTEEERELLVHTRCVWKRIDAENNATPLSRTKHG